MTRRSPSHSRPRAARRWPDGRGRALMALGLLLAALGALGGLLLARLGDQEAARGAIRPVTGCQGVPAFTRQYGFTGGVIIDTTQPDVTGLVLRDPDQPGRGFQLPSWKDAGNLGPFAVDQAGNIYVGPVPKINTLANPPDANHTIWRVDSATGAMQPSLDLPPAAPTSERNPFGVLGLAYDCDTHSLYAASVAGSGPTSEVGRLFQIDLRTGQIVSQAEGIDAMGLVVAHTPEGPRLLYGAARTATIGSIALDASGGFVPDTTRPELDLTLLGGTPTERARRLVISDDGTLTATVIPFAFSLAVQPTDAGRHLMARYDLAGATWVQAEPTTP